MSNALLLHTEAINAHLLHCPVPCYCMANAGLVIEVGNQCRSQASQQVGGAGQRQRTPNCTTVSALLWACCCAHAKHSMHSIQGMLQGR